MPFLSRDDFKLIQTSASFAQYYLKLLSEGYVSVALTQLQRRRPKEPTGRLHAAFRGPGGGRGPQASRTDPGEASIAQAADMMNSAKSDNLLVTDERTRSQWAL
jgi:hypothetical protein